MNEMHFVHEMILDHEMKRYALHEMMPSASLNEIRQSNYMHRDSQEARCISRYL